MRITFADKKLLALCSSEREQKRELGAVCSKKLRTRLADIDAAARVSELTAGRPHPLLNDRAGQFSLDLDGGFRLLFESAHPSTPLRDDGSIAWDCVTEVRIVFIGDHHD